MKRILANILIITVILSFFSVDIYGQSDELGFFGGISEGTNLPKTIEKYVENNTTGAKELQYKEVVFISGEPIEFEGTIRITSDDDVVNKNPFGSYRERYDVTATNVERNASLDRNIQFDTSYRVIEGEFKKQIIRDSKVTSWDETIEIDGVEYELDERFSTFSKSSAEDLTPGVRYYNQSISYNAEYLSSENEKVEIITEGSIYGYSQPWSKVESQKLTMEITGDNREGMVIELSPTFEAKKTMYYDLAAPYPISFEGTYNQRLEREASLDYNIITYHPELTDKQKSNSILINTSNEIEKLPIPENLEFMKGHFAEEDIKKLYSMEILTDIPNEGIKFQAMPRGKFVKALCLAMNIDTSFYEDDRNEDEWQQVFGDVTPDNPLYPYIMAAYDAKLIKGTGENFSVDVPITRQEAFVIYIRVIGLERLGISENPQTPFVDDREISSWARKEIQAGYNLGIIKGDNNGRVLPKQWISKAEAGAIINRLIDYLREDIAKDYRKL